MPSGASVQIESEPATAFKEKLKKVRCDFGVPKDLSMLDAISYANAQVKLKPQGVLIEQLDRLFEYCS